MLAENEILQQWHDRQGWFCSLSAQHCSLGDLWHSRESGFVTPYEPDSSDVQKGTLAHWHIGKLANAIPESLQKLAVVVNLLVAQRALLPNKKHENCKPQKYIRRRCLITEIHWSKMNLFFVESDFKGDNKQAWKEFAYKWDHPFSQIRSKSVLWIKIWLNLPLVVGLLPGCLVVGLLPKPVFVCIPGHALQFWLESPLTRFRPRMITVLSAGGQNQPLLSAGYLFSLEVLSAYQAIFSTSWYLVGKMETNYKIRAE